MTFQRLVWLAIVTTPSVGCMLTPHDRQNIGDPEGPIAFSGYFPAAGSANRVQLDVERPSGQTALGYGPITLDDMYFYATPNDKPDFTSSDGYDGYSWSLSTALPREAWTLSATSRSAAVTNSARVHARALSMPSQQLVTVNADWYTCRSRSA
jgi:hypothetical protein